MRLRKGIVYQITWLDHAGCENWDDENEYEFHKITTNYYYVGRKGPWLKVALHKMGSNYTGTNTIVTGAVEKIIELATSHVIFPDVPGADEKE